MGFWSSLAKIGGDIGGSFIGDPMLGNQVMGVVDSLSSPAGDIGETAGSIEKARMDAMIAQAKLTQQQDQNQIAANKAALAAPGSMAQNAVRGDVLANAKDATVSGLPSYIHVPTIGGGLRPSLFSAATRNLGSQMSTQANQEMAGGKFTTPTLTPLPQASAFDNVLSGTALAGGFLNAARGLIPHGATAPTDPNSESNPDHLPYGPDAGGPGDTSNLPGGSGLDPAMLAWWQQQANGGTQ